MENLTKWSRLQAVVVVCCFGGWPSPQLAFLAGVRKKLGDMRPGHCRSVSGGNLADLGVPAASGRGATPHHHRSQGALNSDQPHDLSLSRPLTLQFQPNPARKKPSLNLYDARPPSRTRSTSSGSSSSSSVSMVTTIDDQKSEARFLDIDGALYPATSSDLIQEGQIGRGISGLVMKMLHKPSRKTMAVKIMPRSGSEKEMKRVLMELYVTMHMKECPHIVKSFGCIIEKEEAFICMEMMTTCLGKLLKKYQRPVPEAICAEVAHCLIHGLKYLKEERNIIHRDIKPSNILLDAERGEFKICDFGISGVLVNSQAMTREAGCTAYMAPERFAPGTASGYDARSDVWSVGITLVELATAQFPYPNCSSQFEVLSRILNDPPPELPADSGFTPHFQSFIASCLAKDRDERPVYLQLVKYPFLVDLAKVDVCSWYKSYCAGD